MCVNRHGGTPEFVNRQGVTPGCSKRQGAHPLIGTSGEGYWPLAYTSVKGERTPSGVIKKWASEL